jgi:elongation factor Ts
MSSITSSDIAKLRASTGAGMMDCKNALEEAGGDQEKAGEILRKKGIVKAAKRADKVASEGVVSAYIHGVGKIGVLLEVNCETDFVARTDGFKDLVREIAMHIAATNPRYLDRQAVSTETMEKEKEIYSEQLKQQGKPQNVIENILKGKFEKFYEENCLLEQPFIKDDSKKIQGLLAEKTAETGEKITIRRFVRFELGEGIEKTSKNFADEVAEQMK